MSALDWEAAERMAVRFIADRIDQVADLDGPETIAKSRAGAISVRLFSAEFGTHREAEHRAVADEKLTALINEAESDPLAFAACGELLEHVADEQIPVPAKLSAFFNEVAWGKRKRPGQRGPHKPYQNLHRDVLISQCVAMIVEQFSIAVYGSESREPTAVDVVSAALWRCGVDELGADGVKRVVQRTK